MSFKLKEVRAPYVLPHRENFFNQPPFTDMYPDLSGKLKIPIDKIKIGSLKIAKSVHRSFSADPYAGKPFPMDIPLERAISAISVVKEKGDKDLREKWELITSEMDQYPLWQLYLATQHDPGVYNEDGTWNEFNTKEISGAEAVDSYAWWITKHFSRLGRRADWPVPKQTGVLTDNQVRERLFKNNISVFVERSWVIGVNEKKVENDKLAVQGHVLNTQTAIEIT